MNNKWHGQVIEDIKQLLKQSIDWRASFTYREGNKVAHSLAKLAFQEARQHCWIEEGPVDISNLILADQLCNVNLD